MSGAKRRRGNGESEASGKPRVRCAIYTRKSSDEGLDQEFNSLDAQRESAEAYIASQKAEGWVCNADRYDDGGYSGGSMERPALTRLLRDIDAGKVGCVVVYKVDRLSRSLMDVSRIMETFEKRGVSFVSVTQQFNTTHSMGRLTLNILLSFAQFERESIGDRIRDKIAAQKRKGKWAGGRPRGSDADRSAAEKFSHPHEVVRRCGQFELLSDLTSSDMPRPRHTPDRFAPAEVLSAVSAGPSAERVREACHPSLIASARGDQRAVLTLPRTGVLRAAHAPTAHRRVRLCVNAVASKTGCAGKLLRVSRARKCQRISEIAGFVCRSVRAMPVGFIFLYSTVWVDYRMMTCLSFVVFLIPVGRASLPARGQPS